MIKGQLYRGKETIQFQLPSGYDELTFRQLELINDVEDEMELFSRLTGLDLETVKKCRKEEVFYILDQLNELYAPEKAEQQAEFIESFELKGQKYYVDADFFSIPAGQWWDMKKFESELIEKPFEFLPRMLSIICRPKGEEYNHAKSTDRVELFRDLDVNTAFKIRGFFLSNLMQYLSDTNHSSRKTTRVKKLLQVSHKWLISLARYLPFLIWQKTKAFCRLCLAKRKK